ncbi:uncharacterized protein LOC128181882 isoform X2 [Crassostrea angulata]|uniref:uncharacterized protein LOC128181882 isoform X2 n=1 Tax=Magallana angulata TaxID=2784310 RepID=UPI0022B18481|nr:uncharacterized protein LOC128181882 isoform X2 [Crassostrea angulata]
MLVRSCLLFGVVLAVVLSVPVNKKRDEDVLREEVRELVEYLKGEQLKDESEKYESLEKRNKVVDRKSEKSRSHSDMLDEKDVDPNDDKLMVLMEGMAVEKNGKVYTVQGLHPELTAFANASKLEKLPSTPNQMDAEKRSFLKTAKKWPKAIVPYKIDKKSIVRQQSYYILQKAVNIFNSRTCLKWLPHTPELAKQVGHNHYVEFKNSFGCYSNIGYYRDRNRPQEIGMYEPYCMNVGTAVHEMLHAAGFRHEHSRKDRDEYIRLIKENLGYMINDPNFAKGDTLDRNPYDYESIMQYGLKYFSTNGKQTIKFLDKDLEFLAGTGDAQGMDFYDVKDVVVNYQCAADCKDPPKCTNGGFVNHKCECYCPRGYKGKTCETVISDGDCGGMLDVPPGKDVFVVSPGYPAPYPLGKICRWGVKRKMLVRTLLLIGIVQAVAFSVPVKNKKDKDASLEKVREILDYLKGDKPDDELAKIESQEKRLFRKQFTKENNKNNKRRRYEHADDKNGENLKIQRVMFDKEDVDPNDEKSMLLLERMAVMKNGKVYKVKGLHPELTGIANASRLDKHPSSSEQVKTKKRNFWIYARKWPKAIIPYTIDTKSIVQQNSYTNINEVIGMFNTDTCLKWLPHTPELATQVGHNNYVKFSATSSSLCSSRLGYTGRSAQPIRLNEPYCMHVQTIGHEMMHAAGFEHEQSRSDRDDYIRVIKENFNFAAFSQLAKENTTIHNPYDYESVLQYFLTDFSSNGKKTMEFLDRDLEFLAGTGGGQGLDFYDIKDIIVDYQCAAHCKDPPECINGGFINHDCVCYCPMGYTGKTCETVITDNDCGGMVDVPPGKDVFVISPGYPASYPFGKICRWGVKAPDGWFIRMTVEDLHLPANFFNRCYSWLEIQYNLPGQTGIIRCGDMNGNQWTGSKDSPNFMTLTFNSMYVGYNLRKRGFRLRFNAIERNVSCRLNPCLNGGACKENGKSFTCTCPSAYTGTRCENEVNCKRSLVGWEYASTTAVTVSGRNCQRWKDLSPHNHRYTALLGDQENYCRNPDREPNGPWCYTTDPAKRWEYCDIPKCVTPPNKCLTTAGGANYFGHVNTTVSGRTCMRWDSQSPHGHSFGIVKDQGNYCRNPYKDEAKGPWCYTTDPNKRWEFCNIPCMMYRVN